MSRGNEETIVLEREMKKKKEWGGCKRKGSARMLKTKK